MPATIEKKTENDEGLLYQDYLDYLEKKKKDNRYRNYPEMTFVEYINEDECEGYIEDEW